MVKHLRRMIVAALVLSSSLCISASAQSTPQTSRQRLLSHFDGALSGTAVFTKSSTGTASSPALPQPYSLTTSASNTAGALLTLRASKTPWIGLEANYGYARFSEKYNCCGLQGGLQTSAHEFTFGWLFKPQYDFHGTHPYAAVGAGTMAFRPTKNGGQGLQTQARAVYYYNVGVDAPVFGPNAGIRAGFRQLFYLAPDFGQNYITAKSRTFTSEPTVGFYYHF